MLTDRITAETPMVVLTGAGISKESGLSTFRDPDGIWSQVSVEEVATPEAFARDPARVHEFYNQRRRKLQSDMVAPNAAHEALARLEREWKAPVTLVTQNIDDLHERAGSRTIIHMHGELLKARCTRCGSVAPWPRDITLETACPNCGHAGSLRPQVVWFGEEPFMLDTIAEALYACGLFMSIGTSGNVYPAAGFVATVQAAGKAHTMEVNMEPSDGATLFAETVYGPATKCVPDVVDCLLELVD